MIRNLWRKWEMDDERYGFPMWLTGIAVLGFFVVCAAFLSC